MTVEILIGALGGAIAGWLLGAFAWRLVNRWYVKRSKEIGNLPPGWRMK